MIQALKQAKIRVKKSVIFQFFYGLGFWVMHTTFKFFGKRSVQTHILACLIGAALSAIALRTVCAVEPVNVESIDTSDYTELTEAEPVTVDTDAECIARVLYGLYDYNLSDNAKTAVVEVVLNRVGSKVGSFGDSIEEVCNKPKQWQGYVKDGVYLQSDYDLAYCVLHTSSNARLVPEGCYFLLVKNGEIVARTEWSGGNEWSVR